MKKPRVNRRLVLIAFLVAVLIGGGGQAVALWQQSSNLTMQVASSKLPPVNFGPCDYTGNSGKARVSWEKPPNFDVSHYVVTVYKNGDRVGKDSTISTNSLELNSEFFGAVAGDILTLGVVAFYSGYSSPVAISMDIRVIAGNNAPLRC
ncbi:hypothetical protein [uncultured Arthrobacter sp.]|uniref:hypothetical protein n=1 Tax=uncultured Arthrobacter sp. TaxID=114050 RepID=UPI00263635C4|nr:hypothetical protein [uncultured Arthrobacter sp.]